MKKVVLLLVAMTVFMFCASVGYALATRTFALLDDSQGGEAAPGTKTGNANVAEAQSLSSKNNCFLSIQVDRLDVQRPQLVSAWVTYLFFDVQPYKINFLPVYFPSLASENSKALAKTFELDDHGVPSASFWRAFGAFKTGCKDYVMIDEFGVIKVLNWINGRSDMDLQLQQNAGNADAIRALLEDACDKITGSASRQLAPFRWTDLAPGHIRTNLMMDTALTYWDRVVNAPSPDTCSVSK